MTSTRYKKLLSRQKVGFKAIFHLNVALQNWLTPPIGKSSISMYVHTCTLGNLEVLHFHVDVWPVHRA